MPTTWILYGLVSSQLGNLDTPIDYPPDRSVTTVAQFLETVFGYAGGWVSSVVLTGYYAAS
jgi:hypothetical protein